MRDFWVQSPLAFSPGVPCASSVLCVVALSPVEFSPLVMLGVLLLRCVELHCSLRISSSIRSCLYACVWIHLSSFWSLHCDILWCRPAAGYMTLHRPPYQLETRQLTYAKLAQLFDFTRQWKDKISHHFFIPPLQPPHLILRRPHMRGKIKLPDVCLMAHSILNVGGAGGL